MTRKLTFLILALFALISGPGWGQNRANYIGTFEKISSVDDFTTGYYVITGMNVSKALGNTANSNKRIEGVAVSISNNTITNPSDVVVYYITVDGTTCTFQNYNNRKYMYQVSTSSGKGMGFSDDSKNITFDGYADESSYSGFKFTLNEASNNYFKWNNSSSWFANYGSGYTSSMTPVWLYKLQGGLKYSVIYNANNATSGIVPVDENEYESGASVTVLGNTGSLAKTNYTFDGWNTQANGEGTTYQEGDNFNITANTTLYAKWTASQQQYPVTYKANGGTGEDIVEQYFENETVTIANCTFSNTGHNFTGWNTAVNGTGTSYAVGATYTMTTAGLTLYAQWEEVTSASYVFNTDAGLAALGITKPSSSAGTNLGTKSYISGNISMNATDGSTPTRVWNSSGSTDLRIYNGGSLSFSIAGGNIVKIELTGNTTDVFSCGETGTFTNGTWTGSAPSVTLTATATGRINTIEVTYISAPQTKVTAPAITPNGGNVYGSQSVSISCSTDGTTILYTTDNGANWNTYVNPFNVEGVSGTATVKAKATLAGMEDSDEVSATFTFAQPYSSVETVNAITENDIPIIVSMNNWTITSFSGNNLYVTDGTTDNPTIHIYDYYIPSHYMVGGKLSGSLKAVWTTSYDGEVTTIQNWGEISYSGPTFAIEIDDEMVNGSITTVPATEAEANTTVTFTVAPAEGYRMKANTLIVMDATGEEVEVSGNNPYTFTMPASDVFISAEFELIPTTTYSYMYSSNGVDGSENEVLEGTAIQLADGEDLDDNFKFVGWTKDESDVENIFTAGTNYTINEDVIFYAVYAKEEQGYEENVVIVDGSTLNGTATTTETTQVIDGISYKFSSGAKKQAVQTNAENFFRAGDAVLIGKSGAYIHNDNPFGNGITKFEIYANKGASAKVSVGVYFSANEITAYSTGENTWTATLSTEDHVYDASEKLPIDAKYFWYQVTNANNSQIQFRITYLDQTVSHNFYTRVFIDETAEANITIGGPSIIPAGSTLNMGTNTLVNENAANLVIEDGGQIIRSDVGTVNATFKKHIEGYTANQDNYYLIAAPIANASIEGLTTNSYDLYSYDEPTHYWFNQEGTNTFSSLSLGQGYLYANSTTGDVTISGTISNNQNPTIDVTASSDNLTGFNLVGNPFSYNLSISDMAMMDDDTEIYDITSIYQISGTAVVASQNTSVAPCEGFFIQAPVAGELYFNAGSSRSEKSSVSDLKVEVKESTRSAQLLDRAYVNFSESRPMNKFYMNENSTRLYIPQNGKDYAVVMANAINGELPVNFKAEKNGTYTITVNTENIDAEYLHLIDNMTGMDTDLLSSSSYTFEAKTSDYASRFKLVFGVNNTASENSDGNFAFMSDGNLVIDNIKGEATLQIADELGRVISTETVSGSYNKALNLKAGLYILNLNGMTQKIVVR